MTDTPTPVEALIADTDRPQGYPFEFGGVTFKVKPQFDVRVAVHLKRGDIERALIMLLGAGQAEELISLDTEEPLDETVLTRMVETAANPTGVTPGESSASSS